MTLKTDVAIVSDAHLGEAPAETRDTFHRFLRSIAERCGHLVVNGDLFDFWFEYKSVIQREHFATLIALARLREEGVRVTVTGGNHDRWSIDFWKGELGIEFSPGAHDLQLNCWRAWVVHGDGLSELRNSGRITHAVCSHPLTARTFRLIHPDLGFGLVKKLRRFLCAPRDDQDVIARAAKAQADYARGFLARRSDIDLLVMGHTHVPVLEAVAERRWYVNPGAWMDGYRYALITAAGPELAVFDA